MSDAIPWLIFAGGIFALGFAFGYLHGVATMARDLRRCNPPPRFGRAPKA